MIHIIFYIVGTIGAMTCGIIPHTQSYTLPVVPIDQPSIILRRICKLSCITCQDIQNMSDPSCSDIIHDTKIGNYRCLDKISCCDRHCYDKSIDQCMTDCTNHRILSARITLAEVIFPPSFLYEHDCSVHYDDQCALPSSLHPPRYTMTPSLCIGLIVFIIFIMTGIVIDIITGYFIIILFFIVIWIIMVGFTYIAIYKP